MRSIFCFTLLDPGLGPLEVSYPLSPSGLEKPFFEAMKALGVNPAPESARVLLLPERIGVLVLVSLTHLYVSLPEM